MVNYRIALLSGLALSQLVFAAGALAESGLSATDIGELRLAPAIRVDNSQPAKTLEPKNVPDFPSALNPGFPQSLPESTRDRSSNVSGGSRASALRGEAASTTLPLQTHLKLVLETSVDSQTSQPGDIFEAHVKDDLFVGASLVLPRGSLVRGRVADVAKAKLISRAAHIGLKLDQIVTPTGEVIPLDAGLQFRKGLTNKKGQLDPGTNFGTRVDASIKTVSGMNASGAAKGALVAANIATLGAPTIAAAIGSSAIALFSAGDNVDLSPGQEVEVLLINDLGLQIN